MKIIYCLPLIIACLACSDLPELEPAKQKLPEDILGLETVLKTDLEETARLEVYAKLGKLLKGENPERANQYFDRQLELAKSLDNIEYQGRAYHSKGLIQRRAGQYIKAVNSYLHAIDLFEKIGNSKFLAADLNNIGAIFHYVESYDEAIPYYEKAVNYYSQIEGYQYQIYALYNLAICESKKQVPDFIKAEKYYGQALQIQTQLDQDDYYSFHDLNNELGTLSFKKGDLYEAIKYYDTSLQYAEKQGENVYVADVCYNMAEAYMNLGEAYYPTAQIWIDKANNLGNPLPENKKLAVQRYNIAGELMQRMGRHDEALKLLQQGIDIAEKDIVNEPLQKALSLIDTSQKAITRNNGSLDYESIFQVKDLTISQLTEKEAFEGGLNREELKEALNKEVKRYHEEVKEAAVTSQMRAIGKSTILALLFGIGFVVHRKRQRKKVREMAEAEFRIRLRVFKNNLPF